MDFNLRLLDFPSPPEVERTGVPAVITSLLVAGLTLHVVEGSGFPEPRSRELCLTQRRHFQKMISNIHYVNFTNEELVNPL